MDVESLICVQGLLDKGFDICGARYPVFAICQNGRGFLSLLIIKNAVPKGAALALRLADIR